MKLERRTKARLFALGGLVVVSVIVGVWVKDRSRQPRVATAHEITTNVAYLTQSGGYKDGGKCLADFESGARAYDPWSHDTIYEKYAASQRVAADFERTFTAAQIEAMRKTGAVPFSSLDSNQQNLARLLCKYGHSDEVKAADLARSKFVIVKEAYWMHLDVIIPEGGREVAHISFGLVDDTDMIKESIRNAKELGDSRGPGY